MRTVLAILLCSTIAFVAGFILGRGHETTRFVEESQEPWFDREPSRSDAPPRIPIPRAIATRKPEARHDGVTSTSGVAAPSRATAASPKTAARQETAPPLSREKLLTSLFARANVVIPCFRNNSDVPRLDVEMRVEPDGRVTSVRIYAARHIPRATLNCAEKALATLHLGPAAVDRTRTVVWALDLRDREEEP